MTGTEGGRPKRSSNTVRSSVFGQVEPGSAPAGIRQAVNPARAERRRRLRLWSGSAQAFGLDHRRVPRRHTDCPDATSIREPRARPFALCSARPLSKGAQRIDRHALGPDETRGDLARALRAKSACRAAARRAKAGLFDN